jgi:hypothetical protein
MSAYHKNIMARPLLLHRLELLLKHDGKVIGCYLVVAVLVEQLGELLSVNGCGNG